MFRFILYGQDGEEEVVGYFMRCKTQIICVLILDAPSIPHRIFTMYKQCVLCKGVIKHLFNRVSGFCRHIIKCVSILPPKLARNSRLCTPIIVYCEAIKDENSKCVQNKEWFGEDKEIVELFYMHL